MSKHIHLITALLDGTTRTIPCKDGLIQGSDYACLIEPGTEGFQALGGRYYTRSNSQSDMALYAVMPYDGGIITYKRSTTFHNGDTGWLRGVVQHGETLTSWEDPANQVRVLA